MRHGRAGEYMTKGIFQIVDLGPWPGFPSVHIAIVYSSVVLKARHSIEHCDFRRNLHMRLQRKPMFRIAQRCSRKPILRNVVSNPSYAFRTVRVHQPKIDTIMGELVNDAPEFGRVTIRNGTIDADKKEDAGVRDPGKRINRLAAERERVSGYAGRR